MDVEDYLDPVDDQMMMENDIYGESNNPFEKKPLDLHVGGSDIFTTMEPYFGGLKFLCDIFYYMTLNIC